MKGTYIENRAGIIFDYNDPVRNKYALNTVGDIDSLTVSKGEIYAPNINVRVYPNPFTTSTTFEIFGAQNTAGLRFELYNVVGEKVRVVEHTNAPTFVFDRPEMASGIYIYKIVDYVGYNLMAAGKIIIN